MCRIVVTGGAGFIGSHIVEYFEEMGEDIKPLTRRDADLRDIESVLDATREVSCVIHNAAMASDWGQYEDFYNNNVTGTLNVLKACVSNNIEHVIITGSCSVYGEEDCPYVKDENSPLHSHYTYSLDKVFPCAMNYYRDTKRIARELAIDFARDNGLCLTIIDPVWVYGERELHVFYEYLKTARAGIPFSMGSKKNKFHVIYVKELARAYYLAYKAKAEGCFIIGNKETAGMDEIFSLFCKEAGITKPRNLPKFLAYPAGLIMELLWTIFRAKNPPPLTRGRVNMFYDNIEYSTKKIRDELGFECEYSMQEGIEKTVSWYKKEGLL